ncbi:MAG: LCP family protein [Lachnospiraceae bacterium]
MNRELMNKIRKIVGYTLLGLYIIAMIVLLVSFASLNMLPVKYMVILGLILTILAVLMAIMHEKQIASIIASVLSLAFTVAFVIGCFYINKTDTTIADVSTADVQTDIIGVYVMDSDSAETIADAKDYTFGILNKIDRSNTDLAVNDIEVELSREIAVTDYENMFTMMDDLKNGTIGAVIMNEAYFGGIGDEENYSWVDTDVRKIMTIENHVETQYTAEVPDEIPETFIMYLSGIDTYGGVSARSRSDVNILAVVNTKTKNVLLLSTPRDAYVTYSVTGGVKDKLTHAGIYGVEASIDALQGIYDIEIDYYLRLNFSGFVDIIDALGGIDVYSDYAFSVANIRSYDVGYNHVTGLEALAFARERYSFADGDAQRARNQMEVIRAVISQAASSSMLLNYNSVMNAVSGSFETSMPQDQIAALVKMQLSDMAEWNVTSFAPTGTSMRAETYSMPGQSLYVLELSDESVNEAKELIANVYAGSGE